MPIIASPLPDTCPSDYPYAFDHGAKCCDAPFEKSGDDPSGCVSGPIRKGSTCCGISATTCYGGGCEDAPYDRQFMGETNGS